MELTYVADDASILALARLGRTEDIQFSPNNRWLAIAGANEDRILILSIDTSAILTGGPVRLEHSLELTCAEFEFPHGLCWLDDGTIAVANRNGLVTVFRISDLLGKTRQAQVAASLVIGEEPVDRIVTPGSVAANRLDDDLYEILVCNNYAHYVTRHLVDLGDSPRILGSQILVQKRSRHPRWAGILPEATMVGGQQPHAALRPFVPKHPAPEPFSATRWSIDWKSLSTWIAL